MKRILYGVLLVLAIATTAVANDFPAPSPAPEIDASAVVGALGLLGAGLVIIRARSKR